jgi:uncharacterized PurR-regulated membrane protein YhhQ (DUF165 family)
MPKSPVSQIAYILVLLGGILLVVFGLVSFIGYSIEGLLRSFGFFLHWGYFSYGDIVAIICGVVAIIGSKSATTVVWAIVLPIVGIIGGGLGGLLVILGGLIGLIVGATKKR